MKKTDIILAGVGGQGILSIATIIGEAALDEGLHIKQAEVHGMSQRGGDVQSHLRISPQPIRSDLIPRGKADAIIALEPMEALRYLPYLSQEGWIVANSASFENIPNYPDCKLLEKSLLDIPRVILLDVDAMAKAENAARAANMILLGAASAILPIDPSRLERAIEKVFGRKGGEVVEMNLRAFHAGRAVGEKQMKM